MAVSGASAYAKWAVESTFASAASATLPFGHGLSIDPQAKNNSVKIYGIGARNVQKIVSSTFSGSVDLDFVLASPNFWRLVLGSVADTGAGPYTHTYSESDIVPSFTIENGIDLATDDVRKFLGCVVNQATISCTVGEPVKVKLSCMYANETLGTTLGSNVTDAIEPYMFQYATLNLGGVQVARVQSAEITIGNNMDLAGEIGTRFATVKVAKQRAYGLKFTANFESSASFISFMGTSTAPTTGVVAQAGATMTLVFDNGLTSTSQRKQTITLNNIFYDEYNRPQKAEDLIKEDITAYAISAGVVAIDNTTTG